MKIIIKASSKAGSKTPNKASYSKSSAILRKNRGSFKGFK